MIVRETLSVISFTCNGGSQYFCDTVKQLQAYEYYRLLRKESYVGYKRWGFLLQIRDVVTYNQEIFGLI